MGRKRTDISVQLARALAAGRTTKVPSRAEILAGLLRKRCVAANSGLVQLERQLRSQILWALPIERPQVQDELCAADHPDEGDGSPDAAERAR